MFLTKICSSFVNIQSCTPLSFPYHMLNQLISKVYLPQTYFILVGIYETILELANKMKFRSSLSRFLPPHSKMQKLEAERASKKQEYFYRYSFDIKSSQAFTYAVIMIAVYFASLVLNYLLRQRQTRIQKQKADSLMQNNLQNKKNKQC